MSSAETLFKSNGHVTSSEAKDDQDTVPRAVKQSEVKTNLAYVIWARLLARQVMNKVEQRRIVEDWAANKVSFRHSSSGVQVFTETANGVTDRGYLGYLRYIDKEDSAIRRFATGVDESDKK